jgi:flagella basal body P-ring formation protein FlgA
MNDKPIGRRKATRMLIVMLVLFWATQVLLQQWGFGAEMRFVHPSASPAATEAMLEMRSSAAVAGSEVTLRQICRWSDADAAVFEPVGDVILARLVPGMPLRSITLDEVRSALRDAGINLARVRFAGATLCAVSHDPRETSDNRVSPVTIHDTRPRMRDLALPGEAATRVEERPGESQYTLRDQLLDDLAERLRLPRETLQVQFHPRDEEILKLIVSQHRLHIDPRRVRGLGDVAWDVQVLNGERAEKHSIAAQARAWQEQLVATRPVAPRQLIRDGDVAEQRVLVDQSADDLLLVRPQVVGQQAARELRPGTVLTARMIEAAPMVRSGQLVTVTLASGGVQITTVARAMESGSYGQTIRVRNEVTRDQFEATVTGPQTAAIGGS